MNRRQKIKNSKSWESVFEEGVDEAQEIRGGTLDLVEIFKINIKSANRY